MALQQFVLIVDSVPSDEQVDEIFQLPDQPGVERSPRKGIGRIYFERGASTLIEAIASGVRDLERLGMRAVGVQSQDWVTLGDIADRIGRSREMVRLWSTARKGPGGFPAPINPDRNPNTTFYSWAEVAPWLRDRLRLDVPDEEPVLAAADLALRLRALAPRVTHAEVIAELTGIGCGAQGCTLAPTPTAVAA